MVELVIQPILELA